MNATKAMILDPVEGVSSNSGLPYVRCTLKPGGTAWCWLPALFDDLIAAEGMRVMLDLQASEDIDPRTKMPYLHILGIKR